MNLVTFTNPQSSIAEAYRTLRTNLYFATLTAPLKTILVTSPDASPDADDCVRQVLANLAVTLAQSEKKVIAVDANLRAPALHVLFDLPNASGLSNVLSDGLSDANRLSQDALPLQATGVPGLSVLTGGSASVIPTDAFSSGRMDRVIESLRQSADVTLFNAPSIVGYSDAAVLASKVDGTLLVFNTGKTRRDRAQQAKDILNRAHAHVIGAVMLNVKR
jgi:non-specific protein-tyrosine kinase